MLTRIRDVIPPTKHDPADGISRATSKRCGAEPADNASPAKLFVTESCNGNRATTVVGLSVVVREPRLRVPRPEPRSPVAASRGGRRPQAPPLLRHWQFTITKRSSAGQQIFFLAAATSQTTTAEKSGPGRLGDPVPGRGDVEGTVGCAPPAPAARCPHPTSHRAWPVVPSLGAPSPSQHRQALVAASLYLSASSPFASLFMPDICSLLSHTLALHLFDSLSIGLVFHRWCFLSQTSPSQGPTSE